MVCCKDSIFPPSIYLSSISSSFQLKANNVSIKNISNDAKPLNTKVCDIMKGFSSSHSIEKVWPFSSSRVVESQIKNYSKQSRLSQAQAGIS